MTSIYISPLNDDFNRHDGAMVNYLQSDRVSLLQARHHYDLRAFHVSNPTVPFTQTDYNFWHGFRYNTLNVGDPRPLAALSGQETWDTSGGNVTVGKNATYRYSNTITITVGDTAVSDGMYGQATYGSAGYGSVTNAVASFYVDDIDTDFSDPGRTYAIELTLRNFPAQSASPHFDLQNSFIDFSSSNTFDPTVTDSIQFSSSTNSVSAGGDTYLRFPLTLLNKANQSNLQAVRFRLRSIGGTSTFIAQSMRLVDDQYNWLAMDVDTKKQQLTRSVPRAGGAEPGTTFGDVFFSNERPKNLIYITQFNSGHNPTGNDNVLREYFRTQANGDRIEIKLAARDTQSRLFINQTVSGTPTTVFSTATNTNILAQETVYYLMVELNGNQCRASIYNATGPALGSLVYTTGFQTVGVTARGLVGYSFEPYNYDFTVQYIAPQSTQFAVFQSTAFNSRKLVRGATLFPVASTALNLVGSLTAKAWGDATLSTDAQSDLVITRNGTLTQGGVRYEPLVFFGNSSQITLSGSIWTTTPQGTYRAALVDAFDSVLWMGTISNVLANQWNDFNLIISSGILPENAYLHIQQTGTYNNSFSLRNISLNYTTIAWNISPDNGTTWQPFLGAVGDLYSGAMFATPTTTMTLQAVANTDQGWLEGYQLEPQYVY